MKREILKTKEVPNTPYLEVVLAKWGTEFVEYVTWLHNKEYGEQDGYTGGHYYLTYEEALADFEERVS